MKSYKFIIILVTCFLGGCATEYQDSSGAFTGGYSVKNLEGNIYRVSFYGNGYTSKETVQTYWLYKCTEVAIDEEFDGFEILSHITLTRNYSIENFFDSENSYKKAQIYYIPMDTAPKPEMTADIRLMKRPFDVLPPKIFDAKRLQEALSPYVFPEKKCSSGNVCEHVHKYLHPEGKFEVEI